VPLLAPDTHDVPFALALQLLASSADADINASPPAAAAAARADEDDDDEGVCTLHYVLRGAACVSSASPTSVGDADAGDAAACGAHALLLRAGDSVLVPPGARVTLTPAPCDEATADGWECASLLLVLPLESGMDGDDGVGDASSSSSSSLGAHAAVQAAATRWRAGAPAPPLGAAAVAALLHSCSSDRSMPHPPPPHSPPHPPSHAASAPASALRRRRLSDAAVFALPGQRNRFALLYDPSSETEGVPPPSHPLPPFIFGLEAFPPGHVTPRHAHPHAPELFLLLGATSEVRAECNGTTWALSPGDAVVFPPKSIHGLDVPIEAATRAFALQLMLPGGDFAQHVRAGRQEAPLDAEDIRAALSHGCGGGGEGRDGFGGGAAALGR
jgi:hypothetical protein